MDAWDLEVKGALLAFFASALLAAVAIGVQSCGEDAEPYPTVAEWATCSALCSADGRQAYDLTFSLAGWRCQCVDLETAEEA